MGGEPVGATGSRPFDGLPTIQAARAGWKTTAPPVDRPARRNASEGDRRSPLRMGGGMGGAVGPGGAVAPHSAPPASVIRNVVPSPGSVARTASEPPW